MSKAFTKDTDDSDEGLEEAAELPSDFKNYMTPHSFAQLQEEIRNLLRTERPKVVEVVSWAAGNGDRSENGDYIYGKKRLREIDRRIRYLTKQLESSTVVDPKDQKKRDQVFFGATVTYLRQSEDEQSVTIVGIDEAELAQGKISWISPIARALMKSKVGDEVEVRTPGGRETLEILKITYGDI